MDHVSDTNKTVLIRILKQHGLPEFVKTAVVAEGVSQLPDSSFADPVKRQFPCHTSADTWLSYAYFLKNANQIDACRRARVFETLRKRAHDWAIHTECEALQRSHEKQASEDLGQLADADFAIVEKVKGQKYRALPLINAECIKRASDHMNTYANRYPMPWRERAAARILKKAEALDAVDLVNGLVSKAANALPSPNVAIASAMVDRALLVNREHHGEVEQVCMLKAAKIVATAGRTNITKLAANVIDAFDAHYGLKRFYARSLPTPEATVRSNTPVKVAAEVRKQLVRLATGSTYTKAALACAGRAPYRVLGDSFVTEVSDGLSGINIDKIAEIVPTLPMDDAVLLDKALIASGVKTAAALQKAAHVPQHAADWTSADWDRIIATFRK